ncbi:MAG: anti-sigma factor [Gammaproteobacteria bacterium]|nr:anti-sigma factor [Gammaproteobacteria bacterium]
MNCEELSELVYDHLNKRLDPESAAAFTAHLDDCAECRDEVSLLQQTWMDLAELPQEEPSDELKDRFYTMLDSQQVAARSVRQPFGAWLRSLNVLPLIPQGLAAGVMLVAGVLIGAQMNEGEGVDELRSEVRSLNQLVTLSLLQQDSVSERLRGVRFGRETAGYDEKVIVALIDAVGYDKSVNVRLAAIDALKPYLSQLDVLSSMVTFLGDERSPLVQISLIDALFGTNGKETMQTLQVLSTDEKVDNSVRAHVRTLLEESV